MFVLNNKKSVYLCLINPFLCVKEKIKKQACIKIIQSMQLLIVFQRCVLLPLSRVVESSLGPLSDSER